VCEGTAAAAAKSMSLNVFSITFVFAFSQARLKRKVHPFRCSSKSMLYEQGEEDAKEGGSEDTSFLDSTLDVKWVGYAASVLDFCLHVVKKGSDEAVEWWS